MVRNIAEVFIHLKMSPATATLKCEWAQEGGADELMGHAAS